MTKKGFSLIETVIASGILVMVAGASLTLSNTVIKGNQNLADRTHALYLAVEALEVAQNTRDSNYIDENPNTIWSTGLDPGSYRVIFDGQRYKLSGGSSDETIAGNGINFIRKITIESSASGRNINVTVSWSGEKHQVKLSTYLTDSRQQL